MVYFKIQFGTDNARSYNFPNAQSAIRFLSDLNAREFNPILLSDVTNPDLHEWISDFVMSDNNRVLEHPNPELIGRRHAEYTRTMFNRIGRCARPIK